MFPILSANFGTDVAEISKASCISPTFSRPRLSWLDPRSTSLLMATEGGLTLLPRFGFNASWNESSVAHNESDLRRERDEAADRDDATRLSFERDSFTKKQLQLKVGEQKRDNERWHACDAIPEPLTPHCCSSPRRMIGCVRRKRLDSEPSGSALRETRNKRRPKCNLTSICA